MRDKDFQRWGEVRNMGFKTFVLKWGFVAWGLPMFVIMTFIVNKPPTNGFTMQNLAFDVTLWAVASIIYGASIWFILEKMYQNELSKKNENT